MSAAKYTTQLVADTSKHDKALGKSKQQVYNYQKGVEKSRQELQQFTNKIQGGAVSALSKFAVGVGAGVGALETFEKIVRGSQTTSDAWDATMRVCTTTVDSFFTALSTGDFSYFTMGLDNIKTKAKAAQTALDELGNARISFSYFNAKNQADLNEQLTIAKDKSKSQSERDSAVAKAKDIITQHSIQVNSLNRELKETLSALFTETNRLQSITVEEFTDILAIDLLPQELKDKTKAELTNAYNEYLAEIRKLEEKHSYKAVIGSTSVGTAIYGTKVNYSKVNEELEQKGINEEYRKAILYNETLVKKGDEKLINATNLAIEIENGNKQLAEMQNRMLELTNQMVAANNVTSTSTFTKPFEKKELVMAGLPTVTNPLDTLPNKLNEIPVAIQPIKENLMTLEEQAYQTSTAIGAIGNMFSSLGAQSDSAGGKVLSVMGTIASGIGEVIPQIAALVTAKQGEAMASGVAGAAKVPYPGNIIAMTSIFASIVSMFSQIKSITGFANGGIFTGNNTIGDLNLAKVNKGEMILNGTQQHKLFRLLNSSESISNSNNTGEVRLRISGTDLVGIYNAHNKKTKRVI